MELYNTFSFVSDSFHLVCFWPSSMLQHVKEVFFPLSLLSNLTLLSRLPWYVVFQNLYAHLWRWSFGLFPVSWWNRYAMNAHVQAFFVGMFAFLLDKFLEVEFLGHKVPTLLKVLLNTYLIKLCLILWETTRRISKVLGIFFTQTNNAYVFRVFGIFTNILWHQSFYF